MKKIMTLLCLLLYSQTSFALLSPLNQSLEEIKSVVQNAELQQHFPQDQSIMVIQRVNNGYLLKTDKLQMVVEIQYMPVERPGKQQYKLVFHEVTPIMRGSRY